MFVLTLLVVLTVLAGSYPAFLLSSFKPIHVLKGHVTGDIQYLFLRRGLIVFQFCISVFMIITTLFIDRQLTFMRNKDLGFSTHNIAVVRLNNRLMGTQVESLKKRLEAENTFTNISISSGYPGGFYDATTVNVEGEAQTLRMRTLTTDEDFLNTMNIQLVSGRFFNKEIKDDGNRSVVLNETSVSQLGWTPEEALGKRVLLAQFDSIYKEVVGVISDYHFTSLKEKIDPLIISYGIIGWGNVLIRFEGNELHAQVNKVQQVWDSYGTGFPMELTFMDDVVNHLYATEEKQGRVFTILSIVSVLIASLGVLGLASYLTAQRKKEIGIRKILGATINQVSILLMKDLLLLVLVAIVITIPIGYWAIVQWSQGFAYRVPIGLTIFLLGSGVVLLIATLIVGVNGIRAASENPVEAMRTE
jgi:putative ABC transport system permease protein